MTVSAGSLEFQISIDRSSITRALAQVERAFDRQIVNVGIQADRQSLERASGQIDAAFRDKRVAVSVDLNQRGLSSSRFNSAGREAGKAFNDNFAGSVAVGNILADAAQVGVTAIVDSLRGVAGIIGQASQEFRDFDAAVTRFTAKAGNAAPGQIERISEAAKEFAAVTAFAPTEVQDLATQLLSLGATADQVEQNLGAITKTADALGADAVITGRTIQGAVAVYEQLGVTAERASDILGSAIANTAAGSRSGIAEFEQLFSKAGASAASLGIDMEELVAVFAAFRQTGATAQVSATAITKILQQLSTESEKLAANGINVAFNENGDVNLEETLRNIQGRVEGLSGTERIDLLSQLFTPQTATQINAALGQIDTSFQTALETGRNSSGEINRQVEVLNQSLERQRELIGGNLSAIFTSFGQAFEPVESALTGIVATIVKDLGGASGALDPLTAASERFQAVIENNPEITEKLSEAFVTLGKAGVDALADVIDALTAFAANEAAVDGLAESIKDLGIVFQGLARFTQGIIGATEAVLSLGSAGESLSRLTQAISLLLNPLELVFVAINRVNAALGIVKTEGFEGIGDAAENAASQINGALGRAGAQIAANEIKVPITAIEEDGGEGASAEEIAKEQEDVLKKLADATDNALAEIETSQAQRLAAIKQQQLDGVLTAAEAESAIAAASSETTDKIIAEKQRELAEVQNLKQQGTITEQQAAEEITALQKDIADETLNRIELEIEAQERAKQAALDKLDAELDRAQQLDEIRNIENDIASTTLGTQQDLLGAQQELASSRAELANLELQGALERAEAEGRVNDAAAIRGQIFQQQQQAIAQEQQFKQRALELTIQQNRLESQRAIQLAEVAAIEADIAVQKARASGASSEEISGLERIASLRDSQVDAARESAANQDAINSALQEQLDVEGQIAQERSRQELFDKDRIENLKKATDEQKKLNEQLADNQQGIDNALGGAFQTEGDDPRENINSIQDQFRDARSAGLFDNAEGSDFQAVLRELNSALRSGNDRSILQAASSSVDQELFGQLLGQVGRGDLASLVNADAEIDRLKEAQQPIVSELQLLNEQILLLANTPRAISVMTPDPVADAGRIVSDIQRSNAGSVNP